MSEAGTPQGKTFLSPLRYTLFRNIWISNLVSSYGSTIQMVGAAWLMTTIAESPRQVTLVQASVSLPVFCLSLLAGAMADVFDRRRLLLWTQYFMMGISVLLVVFAWLEWLSPWGLLTLTFLVGCGAAVRIPAWQASVREFIPPGDLPGAITLNSVAFNLTRSFAPALGGAVVVAAGVVGAFVINALSYIGLIAVLQRWKYECPRKAQPRERLTAAIGAGLRHVWGSPDILRVCLRGFAYGLGAIVLLALSPLVARDLLGGGARVYGILLGAVGCGGVLAATINARVQAIFSGETILRGGFLLTALGLALTAWSRHLWLSCLGVALGGMAWSWVFTHLNITAQLRTPNLVLARVLAIYQATCAAGFVIGSWLAGRGAEAMGTQNALLVFSLVLLGGAVLGRIWPIPDYEEQPEKTEPEGSLA